MKTQISGLFRTSGNPVDTPSGDCHKRRRSDHRFSKAPM